MRGWRGGVATALQAQLLAAGALAGASVPGLAEDYVAPEAQGLPPDKVAVLLWRDDVSVEIPAIDGVAIDAEGTPWRWSGRAVLVPGRHRITVRGGHGGSAMRCGTWSSNEATFVASLRAGHAYAAHSDKSSLTCEVYLWIEDASLDVVVAGRPPPGDVLKLRRSAQVLGAQLIEDTFAALEARAAAGDSDALYRLGIWHLLGDEPLPASDPAKARAYLARAAAAGEEGAATLLRRLDSRPSAAAGAPP